MIQRRCAQIALAACVAGMPLTGWAASNMAVLDVARVFEEYDLTRDLEALFDNERRALAQEAEQRRANIEQSRRSLAAFDPLSADFQRREEEVGRAEFEFEFWTRKAEKQLKGTHQRWLLQIYRHTQEVVGGLAQERSIDLVLTYDHLAEDAPDSVALRQQILLQKVIYHSERIDITSEVLARLNRQYADRGGINALSDSRGRLLAPASQPRRSGTRR